MKDGRMRVGRLYIAAIVEGKGSRGMKAGVDGATPMSANAQGSLGEEGRGGGGGAVANGWAGVQYRGACRDGGVGGGGEAAQEWWGSLKRSRQCCLVLAVLKRYSRAHCIDCIDSHTAYTTHAGMQYIHWMHILHILVAHKYSTLFTTSNDSAPQYCIRYMVVLSTHVLLLCVHDSLPDLLSPLALPHTQATIMRTDGSSNKRPSQRSIAEKESSCAKRGSAHAPRECTLGLGSFSIWPWPRSRLHVRCAMPRVL
jgi:hypothetical protein